MKANKGVTLIELMVTVAVAITLMAVGLPLFQRMQANSRVTGQTNTLVTALVYARTEAVNRGVPVAVCAKANVSPADTNCGTAAQWRNGWQVFTDNGDDTGDLDTATGEQVIRVFEGLSGAPQVTASAASLRFLASGELDAAGNQSFSVEQGSHATFKNCTYLSLTGQVRTDRLDAGTSCP